jgi:hypothetical protein
MALHGHNERLFGLKQPLLEAMGRLLGLYE